ncbi:MAG: ThiF family adenylyltransferase [Myxococcota bacterium]
MKTTLSMTAAQHGELQKLLYPGDDREAAALILCGRRADGQRHRLLAHRVIGLSADDYDIRDHDLLRWRTTFLVPHLEEAMRKGLAVVKLHSHPSGYDRFSPTDEHADAALFPSIHGWLDDGYPHASAVMLPDGRIFGRAHHPDGTAHPLEGVTVIGDDITIWNAGHGHTVLEAGSRNAQAFGEATYTTLRDLRVAVVGCSGTGSFVIELLARLMIGELVLVDEDIIELKNLNRIVGATSADVGMAKVELMARNIKSMGLGTFVETHKTELGRLETLRSVATADIVIGCMDSIDGRDLLNRLATFYLLPYLDIGVRLSADGEGGVDQVVGSVHYVQPGRSSLLTRSLYTAEDARAAYLRRADPAAYERELIEKYIVGAQEGRPAVAPVNALFSSRAVMELLARLHPYRHDSNREFATVTESLSGGFMRVVSEADHRPDPLLAQHVGRGDATPMLGMPLLSW